MIKNVLVVCIGNICRSPIAECLLRERTNNALTVTSAGLAACIGESAHDYSLSVMNDNGYDITDHVARQITEEIALANELILVMTNSQKEDLEQMFPVVRGRVYCLGEWNDTEVSDPNNLELEVFKKTFTIIDECVNEWVKKLK